MQRRRECGEVERRGGGVRRGGNEVEIPFDRLRAGSRSTVGMTRGSGDVVRHGLARTPDRLTTNGEREGWERFGLAGLAGVARVPSDLLGCCWVPAGDAGMTGWGRSEGREVRSEKDEGRGKGEEEE